jgi:hypothetical protein
MNLQTYTNSLLVLNRSRLSGFTDCAHFAHMLFGLTEEILELQQKTEKLPASDPSILFELGDILAYTTLSVAALRFDFMTPFPELVDEVASILGLFLDEGVSLAQPHSLSELALEVAGKSKRWFRESARIQLSDVVLPFVGAVQHVSYLRQSAALPPVSVEEIAQQNIEKLQNRAQNNNLFQGQGDNR